MDPAGLALGVLGVVGLFSTCMDIIERVESYRNAELESKGLTTQFNAHKRLLLRWADRVGFRRDGSQWILQDRHHQSLDNQDIALVVEDLLEMIKHVWSQADSAATAITLSSGEKAKRRAMRDDKVSMILSRVAKKAKWALKGKEQSTSQVQDFGIYVGLLDALIPITVHETEINMVRLERDLMALTGKSKITSFYWHVDSAFTHKPLSPHEGAVCENAKAISGLMAGRSLDQRIVRRLHLKKRGWNLCLDSGSPRVCTMAV